MDSNVESTKILSTLMDEYTVAQIKSLELKTELAREWSNLRQFYATNFADANDERDTVNIASVGSGQEEGVASRGREKVRTN